MRPAASPTSHWGKHAQQWTHVKAPLRPSAEDIALIEGILARHFPDRVSREALMLGVTPELASKDWSPIRHLLAVDNSLAMIRGVWPENDARRSVVCGNWLQLPLRDACMDLALIDGGLPAIIFPDAHRELARQLHRVLKPGGLFIARIFARPANAETVDDVFAALGERRIGNFHVFKWRLAMALQGEDARRGVRVHDVWHTYDSRFGRHADLERITRWPIEEIRTIDAYRASEAIYHFPSVPEMRGVLAAEFVCVERTSAAYELAERCPILAFRRLPSP